MIVLSMILLAGVPGCYLSRAHYVPMKGASYLNPAKDITRVGRVALVELNNPTGHPDVARDVTDSLFMELQKRQRFSLIKVSQADPVWRNLQLDPDASFKPQQLLELQKTLACDAILTGMITEYQAYPHMSVGIRLRMIDLRDGQLIWAVEQVWDSSDRNTEARIKDYVSLQTRTGQQRVRQELIVISPLNFFKFVAFEMAQTL